MRLLSSLSLLSAVATLSQAWRLKWYSGININCSIVANADFFVVRVWEGGGGCEQQQQQCVPAVLPSAPATTTTTTTIHPYHPHHEFPQQQQHPVSCRDYVYDGGELSFTEGCEREIGRGSAIVESGSCEFYNMNACEGTLYLRLEEGVCDQQIAISNFTCTDH